MEVLPRLFFLILWTVFPPQSYDNGDAQLDSAELLKFIQQNESVAELQSYADQESNKLLRSVAECLGGGLQILSSGLLLSTFLDTRYHQASVDMFADPLPRVSRAAILRSFILSNRGRLILPLVWRDPHPEHINKMFIPLEV